MSNSVEDDKDVLTSLEKDYKEHIEKINDYFNEFNEFNVEQLENLFRFLSDNRQTIKDSDYFNVPQMFQLSLLGINYMKTLGFGDIDKYILISNVLDIVKNESKIRLNLIDSLKKDKFTLQNKFCDNLNVDHYLFLDGIPVIISLENDYSSTIVNLSKLDRSVHSTSWSKDSQNKFRELLLKNNFLIKGDEEFTDENMKCVSLINNFNYSIKKLSRYDVNGIRNNKDCMDYIYNELKKKNYIITKDDLENLKEFPDILLISLENDYGRTLEVLSELNMTYEILSKIIENLSPYHVIQFFEIIEPIGWDFLPKIEYEFNMKMNGNMHTANAQGVIGICDNYNYPLTYLPEDIISDEEFLMDFFKNKEVSEFVINEINSVSLYTRENELKLLKYLNSSYDNLEDYYISIKNKYRSEMSVLEMYGLAYYAKKVLYSNGVNRPYFISIFDYNSSLHGSCDDNSNQIKLYNDNKIVKRMIKTINHECAHAVMFKLINNEDYEIDDEIEVYYKDKILRKLLGNEYYNDNYKYISYEFDAEFRALCMDSKFFGEDRLNKKVDELYKSMLYEDIEYADSNISYIHLNFRMYQRKIYHINELFIETLKKANYEDIVNIVKEFPCIHMDYDIKIDELDSTFTIERKSFERVLNEALVCTNSKKKANYFKLIIRRCDQSTEDLCEVNCEENIYILLKKAREHPELRLVYERAVERNNDKYAKYREKGAISHAKVQ